MEEASRESVESLICLTQVDEEVARAMAELQALPARVKELEERLAKRQKEVAAAEARLKAEEAMGRRLESDLKDQQTKIEKFKAQTSSVKNNEQFHALQHEISYAETEIRRIEDAELECMQRAEDAEAALKKTMTAAADQLAQLEADRRQVAVLTTEKQDELARLQAEQRQLRAAIDRDLLSRYDRIASSRGLVQRARRTRSVPRARCSCGRRPGTRYVPDHCLPVKAAAESFTSMQSLSRRARAVQPRWDRSPRKKDPS